ncbi:hypothetical protein Taro_056649 [Colocasia esculenta]|uniref:Uncharacterized protein n=1 Tax=Colocasia esculenta TaxID=4460 RepID=A0A843XWT5_COLES|nr:hypothetical protein [Colocasia esculenta]
MQRYVSVRYRHPSSKCRPAWLQPKQEITSTLLTPSVGTNERPCTLPERLIFMRPAHPYPHWGGCVEVFFSPTLKDSVNKCVLISKSLTSSPKRALLKDKTPSMGTIPLGRHT